MSYEKDSVEAKFLAGDEEAVGQVSRWSASVIVSAPFWPLRSEWPDIHQEVLQRVLKSLRARRFDPSRSFRAYVRGVARLTSLQMLSRPGRQMTWNQGETPVEPAPGEDRSGSEDRLIEMQLARAVLDQMPEGCRHLVRLHFYVGMTLAEIAQKEDLPVGTVKSRLSRCLQGVRQILHRRRRSAPGRGRAPSPPAGGGRKSRREPPRRESER